MKNKKIALFMLPLLTQGAGAEKYFINLAKNLSERGIQTDVITMDEQFFKKFARLLHIFTHGNFFGKIDISGREKEEAINNQLGEAKWIKVSWKNLKKTFNNYDIVYSKNELVDLFLLKMIGYEKIPPVIVGVHTPIFYPSTKSFFSKLHNFLYLGLSYRWLLRGAKCMHLSNKFTKDLVDSKFDIKTELIYYPFSGEYLTENVEKYISKIAHDETRKNIIFVARLSEQKGIDALVEIIRSIAKKKEINNEIKINIFGSGDEKSESKVRALVKKYSFVEWYGHIENKYVPGILKKHDLFITTAKWETLPFNVLEAQAMGLPVIAFDIPGPNDIISNGYTGFLVKDEDEFVKKIISIVSGDVIFDGRRIIQNMEEKFNPDKIYSELLSMFERNI